MSTTLKKIAFGTGLALWGTVVAGGMKWMSDYSLAPGADGKPAPTWTAGEIERTAGRHTLVVGLHPECPCSRATLQELDRVLLEAGDALEAVVLFDDTIPGAPARDSALFRAATQLPRTRVLGLTSDRELAHFDFRTSGETRLYRPDGKLVFRGGITASRGHVGANPGASAVVRHARAELCGTVQTPAFGCSLSPGPPGIP